MYKRQGYAPAVGRNAVDQMLCSLELPCADMLEAATLEETDLLGGRQTLCPAGAQPVEQLGSLAGVVDLVREDAPFLERCLLYTSRCV